MSDEGFSTVDAIPADIVDEAEVIRELFIDASDSMHLLGLMCKEEIQRRFDASGNAAMEELFGEDNLVSIKRCISFIAVAVAVKIRQMRAKAAPASIN